MKKVLITGSSGYIGSHLSALLKDQYRVYGLDIVRPIVPINSFYNLNIRHLDYLGQEFDAVIHLAALVKVGESEHKPIEYYDTNLQGTLNVLKKIRTKNFIFASTGTAEKCQSTYGISKRAAEQIIKEFCEEYHPTPYTIFRFYNVIGTDGIPSTNEDGLFYNLCQARQTGNFNLYGDDYNTPDGTCIRDYVHVNEIAHALMDAIERPSYQIENLGHGVGYSVKNIIKIFKQVNQCDFTVSVLPRRPGDLETSVLSNPSSYMKKMYGIEDLLKV
jgi:UDP-glucose 4-epimerase